MVSCYGINSPYAIVTILGKHDGTVKGVKYFQCKEKHGLFVRQDKIIRNPVDMKPDGEAQLLAL